MFQTFRTTRLASNRLEGDIRCKSLCKLRPPSFTQNLLQSSLSLKRNHAWHKPVHAAAVLTAAAPDSLPAASTDRDGTLTASTSGHAHSNGTQPSLSTLAFSEQQRSDAHDEQLYEEIRACDHWQDVLDIILDEGPDMSTKRAVQSLVRLNALTKRLPPKEREAAVNSKAFEQLINLLYSKLPSMKTSQVSATTMSLSQMQIQVPKEHLASLVTVIGQHGLEFSARDIATVLHAMVSLKAEFNRFALDRIGFRAHCLLRGQIQQAEQQQAAAPSASPHPRISSGKQQQQQQQGEGFAPQGISMVMLSAAHMGYNNTQLLTSAAAAAMPQLDNFQPQGIANMMWASATLNHYFPELVKGCLAYFGRRQQEFKVQEVANIMWALSQLRHHPQDSARLLMTFMMEQHDRLQPPDLVTVLVFLATFCISPGKQAIARLCNRLDTLMPRCSTKELCNAAWALALLGESSRPVCTRIVEVLAERFEGNTMDSGLLRQTFQALLCAKLGEAAAEEEALNGGKPVVPAPTFPPAMLDEMKQAWVATVKQGVRRAKSPESPTAVASKLVGGLRVRHDAARTTKDGLVLIDIALRPSEERYVALQVLRDYDYTRNTGQLLGPVQFQRQILEKNGWEVKFLKYADLMLVDKDARPFFMAEYLRSLGCRMVKTVKAPGAKVAAGGSSSARTAVASSSEEVREADMVLRDPKANVARKSSKPRL